jgi:hypothetical protein
LDSSAERRRATRVTVELEGELQLAGYRPSQGLVWDLSEGGSLFIPRTAFRPTVGTDGILQITFPGGKLDVAVRVVRVADVQLSSVPSVRGLGIEFRHLRHDQQRALADLLAK